MKILSIRIKNIASLSGEHFINFEDEPLASTGLIAITGKTGAGKSTILDAICLALYSEVPRFKGITGSISDVSGQDLTLKDPKNILRRGCVDGFAELEFLGTDHKRYLAQWKVWRAHKKIDGTLKYDRSIINVDEQRILSTKSNDCTPLVEKLIGLSFEQFTRAVLLAQSEVTALLKAPDSKRSELLEYLTNSSIFAKIGQLSFEKTREISNQRKELENVLGHIQILSDDDVQTLKLDFNQHQEQLKRLELEKKQLEQQQQWFEQQQKWLSEVKTRQQYLQQQQQKVDELVIQQVQIKQLESFSEIRSDVLQQKNVNVELTQLRPQLEQAQLQFQTSDQQFNSEKSVFEHINAQHKTHLEFKTQQQEKIELVRDRMANRQYLGEQLQKAKDDLEQLNHQQVPLYNLEQQATLEHQQLQHSVKQYTVQLAESANFQPLDDALSAHITQLNRFIQSHTHFEKHYGDVHQAHQKVHQQQQQFDHLTQQYGQDHALSQTLSTLRIQREQLTEKLTQFDLTQSQWLNFKSIYTAHNALIQENTALKQHIELNNVELQSAEKNHDAQKKLREHTQHALQQQRLLHTENIEQLRANLVQGEACLVCGSIHHPYVHNQNALSKELFKLQEQQEQQELVKEKIAFDTWQQLQNIYVKHTTQWDENERQREHVSMQLQQVKMRLEQQLSILDISFDLSQNHAVLDQDIQTKMMDIQHQKTQLDAVLQQHESAQQQCSELTRSLQHIREQLSTVKQSEENIQPILALLNDVQKQTWHQSTNTTAKQIISSLEKRQNTLRHLQELNTQLTQKSQQLNECVQQLKFSQEKIKNAELRITNLTTEGKKNSELAIQAIFDMTQTQIEKPQDWLKQFDQQSQHLQTQIDDARHKFDLARQTRETAQTSLTLFQTQQMQLATQKSTATQKIQQWLNQHTQFNETLLQQLSDISHEQEQQLKNHVLTIERTFENAKSALKTIEDQLNQHLEHQPEIELNQLNRQMIVLLEQISSLQKQRDALKVKLEIHQQRLDQHKQFETQIQTIQAEETRWAKISSTIGDSQGKTFRDVAQQYNLDILLEYANQQLVQLSQRYTLKRLDNSLSLAIIDHDMDGETRSVASLSGGESFLTALALSLAIANMASGTTKIESLFIDEGFGTLDASSLHMVMNALDQLQSQGRKVVLISHIQEMHERIPVQIQVNPIGAGASTIQVVG